MDVMLVAVKKETINEYTSVVREAGLVPVVVDVNAFALGNMYEVNYGMDPEKNVALVNLGASSINLNVLKAGISVFTRDSAVGCNLQTEALQKEFSISSENAERLKRGQSVEGVSEADARAALAASSEEIATEISRSLDFFRGATYEELHEVILSGGGALMAEFPRQLAEKVGLEVKVAEPFRNINIPGRFDRAFIEDVAPMAAVAVGLAMRRQGDR
jgi:type IV pilus assembly protein PilM